MSLADLKRRCARVERKVAERLPDEDTKRFRTMQAEAARRGCELYALTGGGFLLSRWNLTREFGSLADVAALLAQMGPPGGTS